MADRPDIDALQKAANDAYEAWAQASAKLDEAIAAADDAGAEEAPGPAAEAQPSEAAAE